MTFISTPKAADILCGKDKTFGKHPGNMLYRDLIEAKALDYATAVYKLDKMKLTTEIVATMVTEFGSRFLRPVGIPNNSENASTTTADGNVSSTMIGWEEISLTAARDKTSHALRFCAANTASSKVALMNKQAQAQAPSTEGNEIVVSEQLQPEASTSSTPLPSSTPTIEVPPTATTATSLIQSQLLSLQTALKDENSVSQEELLQQQNNALQKGIEELIQQKLKQKEQEQLELKQRQLEAMLAQPNGDVGTTGARTKFKKLPTKASLTIHKTKIKIPESLLQSTATPVKFNRVKVQKSSRKPKITTTVQQALPSYTSSSPQQVPPSPYNDHEQQQYLHPPPPPIIPEQHPMSSSSTTRTVSTDMIVLATAAAAVEAAEARAVAAQQHQDMVEENKAKEASKNQEGQVMFTERQDKLVQSVSNDELGLGMNHTVVMTTDCN